MSIQPEGSRIDEPIAMIDSTDTYYYHADAGSSIRAITDELGDVVELYKYASFGQPTILKPNGNTGRTSSAVNNRFLFTAREWDDATTVTATEQIGWHYFRNRWLSTHLGRFMSPDPLNYVDGPNLYNANFIPGHD